MPARIVLQSELDRMRVELIGYAECQLPFVRNGASTANTARERAECMLCDQARVREADLVVVRSDIELDDTYILDANLYRIRN